MVTRTLAVPAEPAGVVAVMVVALITVTLVAALPPMLTAVAPVKLVPVMVTVVPPGVVPLVGLIAVIVGAGGMYVNRPDPVDVPTTVDATTSTTPAACAGVVPVTVVFEPEPLALAPVRVMPPIENVDGAR